MNKQRIESRLERAEKQLPRVAVRAHLRTAFELYHKHEPTEAELSELLSALENFGQSPQYMNAAEAIKKVFGNPNLQG